MRDSDAGQRYGHRGPDGRIVEAYGFDLSLLAVRYDEFVGLAAEAEREREKGRTLRKRAIIETKERDRVKKLRKRATVLRRTIRQAGETLRAIGTPPSAWTDLESSVAELVAQLSRRCPSGELALVVAALESRLSEAEAFLREGSGIVAR
jgi:replication initiation protein RepC